MIRLLVSDNGHNRYQRNGALRNIYGVFFVLRAANGISLQSISKITLNRVSAVNRISRAVWRKRAQD